MPKWIIFKFFLFSIFASSKIYAILFLSFSLIAFDICIFLRLLKATVCETFFIKSEQCNQQTNEKNQALLICTLLWLKWSSNTTFNRTVNQIGIDYFLFLLWFIIHKYTIKMLRSFLPFRESSSEAFFEWCGSMREWDLRLCRNCDVIFMILKENFLHQEIISRGN